MSVDNAGHTLMMSILEDIGFDCNGSSESDKNGWDILAEMQAVKMTGTTMGLNKKRQCKIQVKTSETGSDDVRIKLLPLMKLISDPLPAFIVFLSKDRGQPGFQRMSLCHVGKSLMKLAKKIADEAAQQESKPNEKWVKIPCDLLTNLEVDRDSGNRLKNYINLSLDIHGEDYFSVKDSDRQTIFGGGDNVYDNKFIESKISFVGKEGSVTFEAKGYEIGKSDTVVKTEAISVKCSDVGLENGALDFGKDLKFEELVKLIRARRITQNEHRIVIDIGDKTISQEGILGKNKHSMEEDIEVEDFILQINAACKRANISVPEPITLARIGGSLFGNKPQYILQKEGGGLVLRERISIIGHHHILTSRTMFIAGIVVEVLSGLKTLRPGPFLAGTRVHFVPSGKQGLKVFKSYAERDASYRSDSKLRGEIEASQMFLAGHHLDVVPDVYDRRIRRIHK